MSMALNVLRKVATIFQKGGSERLEGLENIHVMTCHHRVAPTLHFGSNATILGKGYLRKLVKSGKASTMSALLYMVVDKPANPP